MATPATETSFRLVLLRAEGDTVYSRVHVFSPKRIPPAVADSALQRLKNLTGLARGAPPEFRAQANTAVRNALRTKKVPTTYPPFVRVSLGDDGTCWLEEFPAGQGHRWIGFGPDGRKLGVIELGARSRLKVVKGDQLWVVEADVDDIQSVVRYRVVAGQ